MNKKKSDRPGRIVQGTTKTSPLKTGQLPGRIIQPKGKLLYKDDPVIKLMYDKIIALDIFHRGQPGTSPSSFFSSDFSYVTNQFGVAPSFAKWFQSNKSEKSETLHEFHLMWDSQKNVNFEHLALQLSNVIGEMKSVREVWQLAKTHPDDAFIWPGMPLQIYGASVQDNNQPKFFWLCENQRRIKIELSQAHDINWNSKLFKGRLIFTIGLIIQVDKEIRLRGAAVFL